MGDDAQVEILITAKNLAGDAFRDAKDQVNDLTRAMDWNSVSMGYRALVQAAANARQKEFNEAVDANTVRTWQNVMAQQAAAAATLPAIGGFWGIAAAVAAATVVLWPFVMLVGSAAIALVSFTAGAIGFLAIAALVAGAFGVIGAAVMALGVAGMTSGSGVKAVESGALTTIEASIAKMTAALQQQAVPLASMILLWVNGAIPAITQLGQLLMTWFGDRLPAVLSGMSKVIRDLSPDFQSFAQYFGGVMDRIGPLLAPMAEAFARLALQGARGLLDNLVRLSEWFVKELPGIGPIVAATFGKLGDFIQWVADNWKGLNDFVVNKWPTTLENARKALQELSVFWDKNGKAISEFAANGVTLMGQLSPLIIKIMELSNWLNSIGTGPTNLLKALNDIVDALKTVYGYIEKITGTKPGGGVGGPSDAWTQSGPTARQAPNSNYAPTIHIYGTDTNNAQDVASAVANALIDRSRGMNPFRGALE